MALDALKAHVVEGLRAAREELLAIKPNELTFEKLTEWHVKHNGELLMQANQVGGVFSNSYGHALRGHQKSPREVLQDVRATLVGFLDTSVANIDATQTIETILESNIRKVKDQKLSTLLLEFNAIKDIAPNSAAVIFRTIIMLVIQEHAKLKDATSALATREDLKLDPMITEALKTKLFDGGEAKFLQMFQPGGKAIFDNIVHKPGTNALVDKGYLTTFVEPLNKLLAAIVQ